MSGINSEQEFLALVEKGFNRIPMSRVMLADTETPLSVYNKLASGPQSYLLESVQGGERWGRYSIIGLPASRWLTLSGRELTLFYQGQPEEVFETPDPLATVDGIVSQYESAPIDHLPMFHGGWVGYFGYDVVRCVEQRLSESCPPDELKVPDIWLTLSEEVVIFDNLAGEIILVVNADTSNELAYSEALSRLDAMEVRLSLPGPKLEPINLTFCDTKEIEASVEFSTDRVAFESWVSQVREYILGGDVMQVVPSHRMTLTFERSPLTLYRALRNLNPSPYLYFLDLGDFQVVGSSPEILVRLEKGEVTVRPIAGTRKRGGSVKEDQALEIDLLSDDKEIAEHLMLIDLARNDIGRLAEAGSVKLTEKMVVERYSHVMHIVSNVSARTRPDVSAIDALRATLPAGTVSGAPKSRAMEIIDELETVKRGIYGGAVGYVSWAGNMDTAIAIRTALVMDRKVVIQAGSGVVADSLPAAEWEETLNKARAIIRAVAMCYPEKVVTDV